MAGGRHEAAQICENGHVVNSSTRSVPAKSKRFCSKCGAATRTSCPKCGTEIQGTYHHISKLGEIPYSISSPPNYCHGCGAPYPWTEQAIQAAKEAAETLLSPEDAATVKQNLADIVRAAPRTKTAAHLITKAFEKSGQAAWEIFKTAAVVFASEEAKAIFAHFVIH